MALDTVIGGVLNPGERRGSGSLEAFMDRDARLSSLGAVPPDVEGKGVVEGGGNSSVGWSRGWEARTISLSVGGYLNRRVDCRNGAGQACSLLVYEAARGGVAAPTGTPEGRPSRPSRVNL